MQGRGDGSPTTALALLWRRLQALSSATRSALRRRFAVDTRALAAVRITLGLVILADLVHRAGALELFYTDAGPYPVATYEITYLSWNFSLHALSGAAWLQQLLFGITGLLAVAFVVGYRTRLVGLACLVLLFSLQARNPAVLNGGDRLLRILLLVALVTPLGERWSIDALRRGSARSTVASVGTAALIAQPLAVFTTNAIEKHRGETWFAGDGLALALDNELMQLPLAGVISGHEGLLTVLNYGWVALVAGAIVFLFVPTGRVRALAALAYLAAFAGMAATLAVGLFPFVLAAAVMPFLTPLFWDALARLTRPIRRRLASGSLPERWRSRLSTEPSAAPGQPEPSTRARLHRLGDRAGSLAGTLLLVWILVFSTTAVTGTEVPEPLDHAHVDRQHWGLYAPDPPKAYAWDVVEAKLADGTSREALEGGELALDPPPPAAEAYETFRHRKFMETVRSSAQGEPGLMATSYADWACQQARANLDGTVEAVVLHRFLQSTTEEDPGEPSHHVLLEHPCRPEAEPAATP